MGNFLRVILKFLANWLFNSFSLYLCSRILPGVSLETDPGLMLWLNIMATGLVFTFLNLVLRPVLLLLTMPVNGMTAGLFSVLINGLTFFMLSRFSNVFHLSSFWTGIFGSFLFAIVNILLQLLLPIDDDALYFDFFSSRLKKSTQIRPDGKRGLIVLEIDGLSYPRLMRAIERRKMPFLKELLDSGKFAVQPFDCGLPSQTSSCQAGIMFGRNHNICAFRWYSKTHKRIISTNKFADSAWMEKELFQGQTPTGLLNNGLSINNIMSGNAAESIFTVSAILPRDNEERIERNLDLYLFSSRPYLLTKSLIFSIFDSVSEIFQYTWARLTQKKPRLNRFAGFYPLIRGVTNILLRDLSTALIVDDISKGGPAVYTTFMGHDEIAHHSGPDSFEALQSLTGIDRAIHKIYQSAESSEIREYDFFVISDHGQSYGATFKQRSGESLADTVRKLAIECSVSASLPRVVGIESTGDNDVNLRAVLTAIEPKQNSSRSHEQAYSALENVLNRQEATELIEQLEKEANDILVLASGNLVNTYFSFADHSVSYEEIEAYYPGFCSGLISHPDIGLILVRQGNNALAIGKQGSLNLVTGEIIGADPLLMYDKPQIRAQQLAYLMSFPDIGDIVIFSPVYADGTVAAFEELIGSHGGMGGEQTQPFIFHPAEVEVPQDIINSAQVYDVLLSSRSKHSMGADYLSAVKKEPLTLKQLLAQIASTKTWTPVLRECIFFSQSAFRKLVQSPELEGPALLIYLISIICALTAFTQIFKFEHSFLIGLALVFDSSLIVALSTRGTALVLRAKTSWQPLLRSLMFTSYNHILWLAAAISPQNMNFWLFIIIILQTLMVVNTLTGISEMGKKRSYIILPVLLLLLFVESFSVVLIYESLQFIISPETFVLSQSWLNILMK